MAIESWYIIYAHSSLEYYSVTGKLGVGVFLVPLSVGKNRIDVCVC